MRREPFYVIRYAKVMFDFAERGGLLDAYAESLASFVSVCESEATVRDYLLSRSVPRLEKRALVGLVWPEAENLALREVVSLVVSRNGAEWLGNVLIRFRALLDGKRGVSRATLETPFPPGEGLVGYAKSRAGELHPGMTMTIETKLEKRLVGGFRLVAGDAVLDASIEARVRHMRERFGIA